MGNTENIHAPQLVLLALCQQLLRTWRKELGEPNIYLASTVFLLLHIYHSIYHYYNPVGSIELPDLSDKYLIPCGTDGLCLLISSYYPHSSSNGLPLSKNRRAPPWWQRLVDWIGREGRWSTLGQLESLPWVLCWSWQWQLLLYLWPWVLWAESQSWGQSWGTTENECRRGKKVLLVLRPLWQSLRPFGWLCSRFCKASGIFPKSLCQ